MQKRSLWKIILLTIITLGGYGIYWLNSIAKDAATESKREAPNLLLLLAPVIAGAVVLVALLASVGSKLIDAIKEFAETENEAALEATIESELQNNAVLDIAPMLLIPTLILAFVYIWKWSKLYADAHKKDTEITFGTTLLMMLALGFPVGMLYIQDHINSK